MAWLKKLVQKKLQQNNLKKVSIEGSPGGGGIPGEHGGAPVFPGQADIFAPDKKRRRKDKNVDKEKQPKRRKSPSRSPRDV